MASIKLTHFEVPPVGDWSMCQVSDKLVITTRNGWDRAESSKAENIVLMTNQHSEVASFPNTEAGRARLQDILWAMKTVYDQGVQDAKAEIRAALGINDRRY